MLRNAQAQTITASSLITILIHFSLAPDDYARRLGLLVALGLRLLLVDQRVSGAAGAAGVVNYFFQQGGRGPRRR